MSAVFSDELQKAHKESCHGPSIASGKPLDTFATVGKNGCAHKQHVLRILIFFGSFVPLWVTNRPKNIM